MAVALKPREMKIVWTTIIVLVLGVLWVVGIEPVWAGYVEHQEMLEDEEKEYRENRDILRDSAKIEREFNRIKSAIPREATDERSAKDAFSEDVNMDATKMLGGRPSIGIVEKKEVKGLGGFSFLVLKIAANGNLESVSKLLKAFDQKGYLIQEVNMVSDVDNPVMKMELTLARIVQIEEPKEERRRSPFGGFSGKTAAAGSR